MVCLFAIVAVAILSYETVKAGDNWHVEVVAEIDKNHTVEGANIIRDEIEDIVLNQNHIFDVNLEFEVDDGNRAWPQQISRKRT